MKLKNITLICKCKAKADYNEKYDTHFCKACNIWLESKCEDKDCFHCSNRPEFPIKICHNLPDELSNHNPIALKNSEILAKAFPEYFDHEE
jgi:hypothetical protein